MHVKKVDPLIIWENFRFWKEHLNEQYLPSIQLGSNNSLVKRIPGIQISNNVFNLSIQ
jgi:hypothetical protein